MPRVLHGLISSVLTRHVAPMRSSYASNAACRRCDAVMSVVTLLTTEILVRAVCCEPERVDVVLVELVVVELADDLDCLLRRDKMRAMLLFGFGVEVVAGVSDLRKMRLMWSFRDIVLMMMWSWVRDDDAMQDLGKMEGENGGGNRGMRRQE